MSIAVIKTGGKQYVVSEGTVLKIEKIEGEIGDKVIFDSVFLVADEDATKVEVGVPVVTGMKVEAEINKAGEDTIATLNIADIDIYEAEVKTMFESAQRKEQGDRDLL